MNVADITNRMALDSLQSSVCPACGAHKVTHQTLCKKCYFQCPRAVRESLWLKINRGYREAVIAALQHLKISEPRGIAFDPNYQEEAHSRPTRGRVPVAPTAAPLFEQGAR